jgi:endonuclease
MHQAFSGFVVPRSNPATTPLADFTVMRLVIADCTVDYAGRLSSHLPRATRLLMVKADGSVSIHADGRAYKPLNWMSPPCTLTELRGSVAADTDADTDVALDVTDHGALDVTDHGALDADVPPDAMDHVTFDADVPLDVTDHGALDADADAATDVALDALDEVAATWIVQNKAGETLTITVHVIHHDSAHALGDDPGLQKDGVEAHLQVLLAEQVQTFGDGWALVRREYPTAIGPVDLLCRDDNGMAVAVEIKRRGDIDGVEQLTRYLELLNRDPLLAPVAGVFAAQEIKPQARTLAEDRGIRCVVVDYDELRGLDDAESRLF